MRAFLASDWPPVDLAITAFRTRELRRILKQLVREREGLSYTAKIEESAKKLQKELRRPVLKAIKEARLLAHLTPPRESLDHNNVGCSDTSINLV